MMRRSLATLILTAATLSVAAAPAPATAAGDLAIRSVTVKPANPVVGPSGSVKLVIDVVARGAANVTVVLEPSRPSKRPPQPPKAEGPDAKPSTVPGTVGPSPSPGTAASGTLTPVSPGTPVPAVIGAIAPAASGGTSPVTSVPSSVAAAASPYTSAGGVTPSPVPRILGTAVANGGSVLPSTSSTSRPPTFGVSTSAPRTGAGSRSEWETWRFLPETALSRWYPSGLWTVTATARSAEGDTVTAKTTFSLRRATELDGVKIVSDGDDRVRVTGTLLRVDPLGRVDYRPFAGQSVAIWFRPAGSNAWQTMGAAVTGKDGWFTARLHAAGDGLWRVEYAGNGHYAPDVSADKRL